MGLASSVGLGIALARPELPVVVLDGDGSLLMNLGGLTTLARYRPKTSCTSSSTTRACSRSAVSRPRPPPEAILRRSRRRPAFRIGLASLRNLDQLPPVGAIVIAAPLKIVGGSGSPLRVIAIAPA